MRTALQRGVFTPTARMLAPLVGSLFFGMGGAKLTGANTIEVVNISEPNPVVQFDERLHGRTIAEVEKLANTARPNSQRPGRPAAPCFAKDRVNTPPPKGGGFRLRLKAGSVRHAADFGVTTSIAPRP